MLYSRQPGALSAALFRLQHADEVRGDYHRAVREFETKLIVEALTAAEGNITRAAVFLSIERTTLTARMKALDITREMVAG